MTDEEKLRITQDAFNNKIMSIDTWSHFKTAISSITKAQVKNFIKANLQKAEQNQTDAATYSTDKATEINALITEVDNI